MVETIKSSFRVNRFKCHGVINVPPAIDAFCYMPRWALAPAKKLRLAGTTDMGHMTESTYLEGGQVQIELKIVAIWRACVVHGHRPGHPTYGSVVPMNSRTIALVDALAPSLTKARLPKADGQRGRNTSGTWSKMSTTAGRTANARARRRASPLRRRR
ncbi:hypothetical protein FGB62_250g01 [Gracilaria domingensis]|nr:hypothetical protein FGB62_250g01 [Gracilaria domingensis]